LKTRICDYIYKLNMIQPPPLGPEQIKQLKQSIELLSKLIDRGIKGVPPLSSAEKLANDYLDNPSYPDLRSKIEALAKWETRKNFTSGFLSSLGGVLSLPLAIPSSLVANWLIQTRMSASIAAVAGFDINEPSVRTAIAVSLLGKRAKEVFDTDLAHLEQVLKKQSHQIPKGFLSQINRTVAQILVKKATQKGFTRLSKAVPILGGMTGGLLDYYSAKETADFAIELFAPKNG